MSITLKARCVKCCFKKEEMFIMSKILDRTDEINYNTYGTKMKIIKY